MPTPAPAPAPGSLVHRSFVRVYPGTAAQVSVVRADLRQLLASCPVADDVVACCSELAANAVLHSESGGPGGRFIVRADLRPGCYVRIEVRDLGGPWAVRSARPDMCHGLDIVGRLAGDWGADGSPASRVLWARIDWPEPEDLLPAC
jgi:serine/threonine-protein kinase RsbW